jgi:sirohydrochlorin cobaltochelatase
MKIGVLVISHGSRETSANREFVQLVEKYRKRHPGWKIGHAFLELAEPSIPRALESLAVSSKEIFILPLFFFSAKHVKKHIPGIIAVFRKDHPGVKIKLAKPLGANPKLLDILDGNLADRRRG